MKLLVDMNLSPNWLFEAAMIVVAKAIEVHREDIERGALLSIDEAGHASGCYLCAQYVPSPEVGRLRESIG